MSETQELKTYSAALVIIDNEILSGRTQDINTQWIAEKLTGHGVRLLEVRVVRDIEDKIVEAVNALRSQVDYVFTTGGIGPTHDDITAASIAKAFGVDLVLHDEAMKILEEYYGPDEVTPARRKMCTLPEGASVVRNIVSGAPGFRVENVFVMAGVPRIMHGMFEYILQECLEKGAKILSRTVSCDLPESVIAAGLGTLQEAYPDVDMGSYPHYHAGNFGLSVVLRSIYVDLLDEAVQKVADMIEDKGGAPQIM